MNPNEVESWRPAEPSLGDRPRVLYLTHRVPFPPDKGDRIRNFHVLRQLARRAEVWLIALADEPVSDETRTALNALTERVAIVPVRGGMRWARAAMSALSGRSLTEGAFAEPAVRSVLREWVGETRFDAALVSASSLAPYLRREGLERVPGFVDLVDVDSQKWFDYAATTPPPKRWLYRMEGARLRKLEQTLPTWAEAVSIVSEAESHLYESFAGLGTATTATNGVDLDYFQPTANGIEQPACAFVGAMDYRPNIDAAIWFVHEVWPAIHVRYPHAEFRIIGRKPVPSVVKLAEEPGVKLIGQVPDVRPAVHSASVVVVPMRLSRGLQNKVLEAMAMGKAVIASPPALAALRTESGTHLLQATTPAEWLAAVSELFDSPERRRELGASARRYVEEHHHWDRCLEPLLDRITATSHRERPLSSVP